MLCCNMYMYTNCVMAPTASTTIVRISKAYSTFLKPILVSTLHSVSHDSTVTFVVVCPDGLRFLEVIL